MGYRKLDQVLLYDHLPEGVDPLYHFDDPIDIWYLGLAGELASEIKCSKITLPMLLKEKYDWQKELTKALEEAISLRPQKHVGSFEEAYKEFSKEMANQGHIDNQHPSIWFSCKETRKKIWEIASKEGQYGADGRYKPYHYDVDRTGLVLDIPPKVIALIPDPEYIGALLINEQFFNFFFFPKKIFVYFLKDIKIAADA